ncbi:MAG: creatininase family protein [Usitatibacteraceae bacterium]
MRIRDCNWMQIEEYLKHDDRAVLPLGCTEQHAYLSLSVDSILAEQMALDAAEPLGIPVFPVIPYGPTASFMAYPGTVSLQLKTYLAIVRDVLDSMITHGFKRILIVNGHGGNQPAANLVEYMTKEDPSIEVKFHSWWRAPQTWAKVQEIDPVASHASWMENFPITRLAGIVQPSHQRPMVDYAGMDAMTPQQVRELLGDGNFGGYYEKPDDTMRALWGTALTETRGLLEGPWRNRYTANEKVVENT